MSRYFGKIVDAGFHKAYSANMKREKKNPVGRPRMAPQGTRIRCELAPKEHREFNRACRRLKKSQNLLSRHIILGWLEANG